MSNKPGPIQAGSQRPPPGGRSRLYLVDGVPASALGRHQIADDLLDALDEHAIVSVADVDGRITYVNDRFCEISGYARDDLIGHDHRIVKSGEHSPAFYDTMWRTISAGRVWHGVFANRRKGGERYWVESTIIPVVGERGVPERYVSIRTDITRQKALEQEVREQRAFLSEVTESVGEGLLVTDAGGLCVFASAEALRLLRLQREQLIGQPLAMLRADAPAAARGDGQRAAPDWPAGRYPAAFVRGDGRRLSAALNVRRLRRGRRDRGAVILFHDDSAERRHQADIERQREQAEQASRAKTAFLVNLSHEIRTPLNGVLGLVRLARDEPAGSERIGDFLRRIEDSAQALSGLVSGVLDLSKIEAGKLSLERVVIDLHELMRSIWEGYVELAQQRGLALRLNVADGVPRHVLADPVRVRQIVVNFVANALKFTARGRVELSMAPAAGGAVRIAVADTGIGIDPEVQAELFKPFVQGDDTTTRRYGGTGLGLSICRELATQMGGRVGVDSVPGQGSTFWAELPLPACVPDDVPPAPPAPPETPLRGRHVLLVEDNEVNQFIARAMLERWGCVVDPAANGAEALELLDAAPGRYDLVLMDLQMPVMGGREATVRIRERYTADELPVVALTAAALAQERDECLELGMNDYLTKPIDTAALQACIARLCAGH